MKPTEKNQANKQNAACSPFVNIAEDKEQEIQLDNPAQNSKPGYDPNCKIVIHSSAQLFITASLIIAVCGLLLKIFGGTNSTLDGFRSATILLFLGLIAAGENRCRIIGRFGYHLSLAAALIFGANFLRLGYKWFEPTTWWHITPLLAVIMGGSALYAFYKVCRARRDRSGSIFAIGCAAIAAAAALRWNQGQGLAAVDSMYSITIFCLLIPVVIFRFREAISDFSREKIEFAPMAIAGLLIVAGGIKFSSYILPQGAAADAIEILFGEDDPDQIEEESADTQDSDEEIEQPNAQQK